MPRKRKAKNVATMSGLARVGVRLVEGQRLRLNVSITFACSGNWMFRTFEWHGTRPSLTKTLFLFDGHALGWQMNGLTGETACDLDKFYLDLSHGFWLRHSSRLAYAAIFNGLQETKADHLLGDIAQHYPHPGVLVPLLQFSLYFSPPLRSVIEGMRLPFKLHRVRKLVG
jgi:hypothetical protein